MTNPESSVFPESQPPNPMLQVLSSYIVRILEIPADRRSVYDTVHLEYLKLAKENEFFKTLYRQEPQPGTQQVEVGAEPQLRADKPDADHTEELKLLADRTEPLPLRIVA